ncbi:MAG TPA: deoxyribose-phosphate aldolase, partial [Chitinophagaceae bacterium]|nr:deoxyribose-phosphate aldolase [Chitinophagaceae bacterium]
VARFQSRSVKQQSKVQGLKMALSMIDLTTLEGKDTAGKVRQLCYKAAHLHDAMSGLPTVAAVCVYPNHVKTARQCLGSSGIRIASVATAFPSGNSSLKIKLADTRLAVDQGADEVDMVINRGAFLEGNYALVFEEIARVKETCGEARLKVILETGELSTLDLVRKASEIAILAGADFIKTSTGKIQPAATLPVTYVMLQTIQDYYSATGKMIGMKPAGGISTAKTALHYLVMLYETLGANWMNAHYFRFGASSLANDILMQLEKENTGHYAGNDYFSKD